MGTGGRQCLTWPWLGPVTSPGQRSEAESPPHCYCFLGTPEAPPLYSAHTNYHDMKRLSPFCHLETKDQTEDVLCLMSSGHFVAKAGVLSQSCSHKASEGTQATST